MSSKKSQQIAQTDGPLCSLFEEVKCAEDGPVSMLTEDQRSHQRHQLSIPVWIRIVTGSNVGPAHARQLADISANGIGFFSRARVEPGQCFMTELCINNATWSGAMQVVHCTELASGYKIGLTVVDTAASGSPANAKTPTSRRPQTIGNLKQLQQEIPKAMKAYRQARSSWGLLGTSLRSSILRVVKKLDPLDEDEPKHCQRRHRRKRMKGDVHLVIPTYYGGKWLRAQILDVSEGGAGLLVPLHLTTDRAERELVGDFRLCEKMPVIVGIGSEPDILWLPAEVSHCAKPKGGTVRVGVEFNTPAAQKAFGA